MVSAKGISAQLPALGLDLDIISAQVSLSETVAPYGQLELVCVAPPAALRDLIDPRTGLRVSVTLTDLQTPWGPGTDTTRRFDLSVRSRPLTLSSWEMQLSGATDEALLMASGLVASAPYAPSQTTARGVVAYVLSTIGATLQPGTDDATLLPNSVSWTPGATGWDFLEPILQAAGLRLFCDEARRWWLVQSMQLGAGFAELRHDRNLTAIGDTIDLDSGGYYDGVVVAYTYDDSAGASHTAYDAASASSGLWDIQGAGAAWLQTAPTLSGGGSSVMQGAAQAGSNGDLYVWHAVPGSNGSSTPYETLVVDRVAPGGGALLGTMTLVDAGHGTSIGIELNTAGEVWVWLHWLAPGDGLANDLMAVKFANGASYTRAQAKAAGAAVFPHSWTDVGGAVPVTSFDWRSDYAVMHLGSTVPGQRAYVRRRISDLRNGVAKQYGATILVPEGPPTLQGFTTLDDGFIRYLGKVNEPAGDTAMIEEWSWTTGQRVMTYSTSALGRNSDGSYPGGRHEPEGVQVYRAGDGTPYLDLGVLLNTSPNYQARVYRQPLVPRPGTPQRLLSLTYNTPKPAAGAAKAILARRKLFGRSLPLSGVADFTLAPGMPAVVTTEDGAAAMPVDLSSVAWSMPDATMELVTRDVVSVPPAAWLQALPGTSWLDVPAGTSWQAFLPGTSFLDSHSWEAVPVGAAWQSVPAGQPWTTYSPA